MSPGADRAFYWGARAVGGRMELYLPWPGFEADVWEGDEDGRVRGIETGAGQGRAGRDRRPPLLPYIGFSIGIKRS